MLKQAIYGPGRYRGECPTMSGGFLEDDSNPSAMYLSRRKDCPIASDFQEICWSRHEDF